MPPKRITNLKKKNQQTQPIKIDAILDALNHDSLKQANKLIDKSEKISGTSPVLRSLRAILYQKMGDFQAAVNICDSLLELPSLDEATVYYVSHVYKTLQFFNKLTQMQELENKNEKVPSPASMLKLFACYTREFDFAKMQQLCISLYKETKSPIYTVWNAICIKILNDQRLLPLSEAMISKYFKEGSKDHYAETLRVILDLFETQKKPKKAIELLNGEFGESLKMELDRQRLTIKFMIQDQQFENAMKISKEIIEKNSDDWLAYETLFESFFGMFSKKEDEKETNIKSLRDYLQKLCETEQNSKQKKRGPFLARMKFETELIQRKIKENDQDQDELFQYLNQFIDYFGHKNSCFKDLHSVLEILSLNEEKFKKNVEEISKIVELKIANLEKKEPNEKPNEKSNEKSNESK
eukprot:Anaeramoba_ignava/a94507_20.p1 GENE.a94507_20~~a94507_20.p1  ORF type:complete len:411 (-),score=164.50 a94507_20:22-1254(-)